MSDTRLEDIKARLENLNAARAQKNTSREAELEWLGAIDDVSNNAPADLTFLLAELERERAAAAKWLRSLADPDFGGGQGDGRAELADALERGEHRKAT